MADRKDPRPVLLIYADKTWDDLAFRDELEALKEKVDLVNHYVLQEPHDDWKGFSGYVDQDVLTELVPRDRYARSFFLCGPQQMMEGVRKALLKIGVAEEHIQMEQFNLA